MQRPLLIVFLIAACAILRAPNASGQQDTPAEVQLKARNAEFREDVIKVADNVYTSVGHTVSTVSMIVGTDGVIIIDTGLDVPHVRPILERFRQITDKPIKAIIFTHGHGDHTGGVSVFVNDATQKPQIWARSNFGAEAKPLVAAGLTIQRVRGMRQAGFTLPDNLRINNGVAPAQRPKRGGEAFEAGAFDPTHTFSESRKAIEVAGVKLELVAATGETDDALYVWYPARRVLFSGDNFYKSFPNLYAIRGTPYRDVRKWAESLDKMLAEKPARLVPGHTRPVLEEAKVTAVLTDFRDAVRFVHDKTVEGMNKGMTPDELVEYVKLPEHLASKPYLTEFYGHVTWSVRSVFSGYLGWFDGNPTNLFRLTPREEAERIAELAGGAGVLARRAEKANADGDFQWAAQLSDYLLALNPDDADAKRVKSRALIELGRRCVTATGRNYYLSVARTLLKEVDSK